jgi:hypothetical protein
MITLSYLNEPGVLWNLKVRYQLDDIYTYTGSILIAVNPFTAMPHLYGTHMMDQYRGVPLGDLSPHVYAIADAAYCQMRRANKSQSILVRHAARSGRAVGRSARQACRPPQLPAAAAPCPRRKARRPATRLTPTGQRRVWRRQDGDQQADYAVSGVGGRLHRD